MNRNRRLGVYLLVLLVLFGAGLVASARLGNPQPGAAWPGDLSSNADADRGMVTGTANVRPAD